MNKKNLLKLKKTLSSHSPILLREEYLSTAVLIPLINIDNEYHLLFEKRAANIRQGGEICFPGGEHDENDNSDFEVTAVRETVEELGIDKDNIEVIGELGILFGGTGAIINAFIGELKSNDITQFNFDKTEVEKIFTIPVSFFQNNPPEVYHIRLESHPFYFNEKGEKITLLPVEELKLPSRYSKPWGLRKRKILVYKTGEEVIWGLTANLIYEFIKRI